MENRLAETLAEVAAFCDTRKVGHVGSLGFRRSSDLGTLVASLPRVLEAGVLRPGRTRFLDMGCADGRVNLLLSYLTAASVGIELHDWILDDYTPLRRALEGHLLAKGHPLPPENITLLRGDSLHQGVYDRVETLTGLPFEAFDLFYTYLVLHEELAERIARKAKPGAVFMLYGVGRVLPRLPGLRLMEEISPLQGILALYRKEGPAPRG